jgi:catechol 2,3-dioxygenase-like lactoylglutathione lyase family enzyme
VPITSTPDHVAVAVPSIEDAGRRYADGLRGAWLTPRWTGGGFGTRQMRFANTGKLELLEPDAPDGFAAAFLERFGARIHHVTLKVPDLAEAIGTVEAAGFDTVDVSYQRDEWHEAFLRPTQVGGIIVQLARSLHSDQAWADLAGQALPPVDPQAPALLGPTLRHPDLDEATRIWETLGAHVVADDGAVVATWADAPLTVRIEPGDQPGPRGLRFSPDPQLAADGVHGPATLPA